MMGAQASSIATMPFKASTNGPFDCVFLMTSWVAAGSVAVETPAKSKAKTGAAPKRRNPPKTTKIVTRTTTTETISISRPCEKVEPGRTQHDSQQYKECDPG